MFLKESDPNLNKADMNQNRTLQTTKQHFKIEYIKFVL